MTFKAFVASLTSAGTAQEISSSKLEVRSAIIFAASTNTGRIYIGDSDANSKAGTGFELDPDESYVLDGDKFGGDKHAFDLNQFFFDGATTGNKVIVHYFLA
jgi:hypothetical protein